MESFPPAAGGGERLRGAPLGLRAPNWVGDLVMATPVLEAAFERHGPLPILLRPKLLSLLDRGPLAPCLVPVADGQAEVEAWRRLAPRAALLLSSSLGAAWRAFRGRVPVRLGAALSGRRALLTRAVLPPRRGGRRLPWPTADLQHALARLAGLEVPDRHPRLALGADDVEAAELALRSSGLDPEEPYLLCCPGAAFGASKLWPPERFAAAVDRLARERGLAAIVAGGPGEDGLGREVAERSRVARALSSSTAPHGRGLARLAALCARSRLVLVGDSGPRWLAAAFDVPCVSVMGPNFPEVTASSLERCEVVRIEGLECGPCLRRVCPLGHHRCLEALGVEQVLEAAERVLARAEAR